MKQNIYLSFLALVLYCDMFVAEIHSFYRTFLTVLRKANTSLISTLLTYLSRQSDSDAQKAQSLKAFDSIIDWDQSCGWKHIGNNYVTIQ